MNFIALLLIFSKMIRVRIMIRILWRHIRLGVEILYLIMHRVPSHRGEGFQSRIDLVRVYLIWQLQMPISTQVKTHFANLHSELHVSPFKPKFSDNHAFSNPNVIDKDLMTYFFFFKYELGKLHSGWVEELIFRWYDAVNGLTILWKYFTHRLVHTVIYAMLVEWQNRCIILNSFKMFSFRLDLECMCHF